MTWQQRLWASSHTVTVTLSIWNITNSSPLLHVSMWTIYFNDRMTILFKAYIYLELKQPLWLLLSPSLSLSFFGLLLFTPTGHSQLAPSGVWSRSTYLLRGVFFFVTSCLLWRVQLLFSWLYKAVVVAFGCDFMLCKLKSIGRFIFLGFWFSRERFNHSNHNKPVPDICRLVFFCFVFVLKCVRII